MSYLIWDLLIKVVDLYRLIYAIFWYLYALFILYRAYFASKVYFFICKTEFLRILKKKVGAISENWGYFASLGSHMGDRSLRSILHSLVFVYYRILHF